MLSTPIEIGKKYRRRNGLISICTKIGWNSIYHGDTVKYDCGYDTWKSNGRTNMNYESDEDIIEEVKENEMKIEVGKWYKTRGGYKAHILHILDCSGVGNKNIVGYTVSPDDVFWDCCMWTPAGATNNTYMEIVEEWKEPKSGVKYANVYDSGQLYRRNTYHDSAEKAEAYACSNNLKRLACIRIEWKEGQFDD